MSFTERKFETAILGLSILMVGGLGYLFKSPVHAILSEAADVVYEMPRPTKSFLASLFDLGDREVSRRYVNPFAKKKTDDKKTAEAPKAAPAAPKAVAKKKAEEKKKDEKADKKVDVKIVGDDAKEGLGDSDGLWASPPAVLQRAEEVAGNQNPDESKQNKNALSGSQWRALILAQPTKENVAKLVEAYNAKYVDDSTFYTIVTDLFRDNKVENQELGLMAVKAAYNGQSFSVTAQYYDQLAPGVQEKAHAYLLSYAVTSRLSILMTALQGGHAEVVATAAQVVLEGYQKAKNGLSPTTDPRLSRGDVSVNSVASYSKFLPIFQQLSLSQDPEISGLANTALSQIQVAVAAL